MRKQIAAAVLAGLTMLAAGSALADGMSRGSIKDVPVATPSWSGFYLGGGVGYGHLIGKNRYSDDTPAFSSNNNDSAAGGLGTVVIGFDRLVRERYVVGLFAEYDWSSIELTDVDLGTGDTTHFRVRNAFSIGGRGGFLMTPTSLLYMTAGYTWAKGKSDGYFDIPPVLGKTSLDLNGPFVGLGMETQLGRNWSLRGEVRYTMFNEITSNVGDGTFIDKLEGDLLTGRLAVVYKFNRDEPHVAPIK
jgi:outer membrane immunogenic protein